MKSYLKKVLESNGIDPGKVCINSFERNFEGAMNVEWFNRDAYYEAVFYKNNLEFIANFSPEGALLEYRQNLALQYLPEAVRNIAQSKGEIMNCVMKNAGNSLEYELIVRDKDLNRFLIILSEIGKLLKEAAL
ncbi:MAG: hypothetical protein JW801_12115 [Bacteroidales bacterium]|nr:hypothetical protein [Bacteroidales bacterium]